MRVAIWQLSKILQLSKRLNCLQIRNIQKAILEEHVTELNEKTLTGRFLIYLNNYPYQSHKTQDNNEMIKVLDQIRLKELRKYDAQQFTIAFGLLANRHYFKDNLEYTTFLNTLDNECCRRLNELTTKDIFYYLHMLMKSVPNRIVDLKYYKLATSEILARLNKLTKEELVQTIFFMGLQKKQAKETLRECLQHLDDSSISNLTTEEICIICNSTYKTSTKIINKKFLDTILSYINDNLYLFQDPALIITLLKTIRYNRYQNSDLLSTISCTIFFNKALEVYPFPALCHLLAVFSDYCYYDENFIHACSTRCLELLKNSDYSSKHAHLVDQPRLKDIKRLLWCLSNLNYKYLDKNDIKNVIIPQIMKHIKGGELESDRTSLMEIMLYLWMLNYRAYEFVPYVFTQENVRYIKALQSHAKDRLNLLISCIYFEDRELFKQLNIYPEANEDYVASFQLKKRPLLHTIMENLQPIATEHSIDKFEICFQVPGLNILGITGYQKKMYKAVNIEILDEYTTLKNTEDTPNGFMQLKLRLLEGFDEGLIVVSSEEIDSYSDSELQQVLLDELQLVC